MRLFYSLLMMLTLASCSTFFNEESSINDYSPVEPLVSKVTTRGEICSVSQRSCADICIKIREYCYLDESNNHGIAPNKDFITDGSKPNSALPINYSKPVNVKGYYRKNGTYVRPHTRSLPKRG